MLARNVHRRGAMVTLFVMSDKPIAKCKAEWNGNFEATLGR